MSELPKMPKFVIFDCDGVLLDSEVIAEQALHLQARKFLTDHSSPDHPLRDLQAFSRWVDQRLGQPVQVILAQLAQECDVALAPEQATQMEQQIEDDLIPEVRAIPGMRELLTELPQPWAVASNSSCSRLRATLSAAGLWDVCRPHVFSTESFRPKPAPDLHLHIAQKYRALPRNTLVLEDSPTGVQAGLNAGMTVYGFAGGSHMTPQHLQRLAESGISGMVQDVPELRQLLTQHALQET